MDRLPAPMASEATRWFWYALTATLASPQAALKPNPSSTTCAKSSGNAGSLSVLQKWKESKNMSQWKGIRTVIFPARDLQASIAAWTQVLGKAPGYQTPDFAALFDE